MRTPAVPAPHNDEAIAVLVVLLGDGITLDTFEGRNEDLLSLHKYLYCSDNPINLVDPTGQDGELATLLTAVSIGFTIDSLFNVAISPTKKNLTLAAVNIVTLPAGWIKGLGALGFNSSVIKGFVTALDFLQGTEKATKLVLEARNGVVLLGKGEKIVGQVLAVGKKAVDFVAYNRLTGRYILAESKTTLQAYHIADLELKAQSTIQAIAKVEQAGAGSTAAVEEISLTYSSIKRSGLGPYSIDAAGNVLKNGSQLTINGVKVTAIKVVP